MAQTIKLKRSATQNAVPSTSSLALGELAINTYDGKLFIKKNVSGTESIVTIGEVGAGSIGPTELASTAVTAGSYGSTSAIPVITIDADGRITSASTATISGLSADSVTATEIAANAVGISELNVSDGTDGQVLTTDGNGNLAFEDQSGGAASATAFSTNIASGDGSTTAFTLSESPSAESKIIAFINGVFQNQDAYTISGTTLTFDTAPISGTNNVVVYVIGDVYSGESVLISNFSGNGTTTAFTLSNNPGNENNTQVYIDGVYQQKTTYSVSGTTLTFSSAPPTGTNNIEVVMLTSTTVNTPAAGSVVTASMADDSVTASKIVSSAVTTAKIADSNVTTAKIADDAVTIGKIADAALVIESEGIGSNDNDTTLPTSAAVKDYVDTQVAGKDALSELSGDTDDVTEGSTNLYYTDARVGTYISGNRTYGNITTTGYLAGPSTFTIDPAAVGDNTGTLVIAGNLQVDGTTTTVNSTTLTVDDKLVTLGSGSANAGAANGAGIEVDISGATNPSLTYDGTNDEWDFNKDINVTGTVTADGLEVESSSLIDINLIGNPPELNLEDSGGTSGQKRARITVNSQKVRLQGLSDDDSAVTYNFIIGDLSNGNVGIGTTSPEEALDVEGDIKVGTGFKIASNVSSGAIGFNRNPDDGAIYTSGLQRFQLNGPFSGNDFMQFQNYNTGGTFVGGYKLYNSSGTQHFYIDSVDSATLTINADTDNSDEAGVPTLDFKMDGSVTRFKMGVASDNNPYISTESDIALPLIIKTGTSGQNRVYINDTGMTISDGTAGAPDHLLQIVHDGSPVDDRTFISIVNGTGSGDISTPESHIDFEFFDSNTNQFPQARITAGTGTNPGVDANTQNLEGEGYIALATSPGSGTSGEVDPTNRLVVDSQGRVLIGTTSSNLTFGKLQVAAGGETAGHGGIIGFFDTDASVGSSNLIQVLSFSGDTDATGGQFIRFRDNNSVMGSISAASGTTVAYNTSSDERMKENIVNASSQLNTVKSIQIREFDWVNNGHHEVGVIAQELNEIIPNVVQEGGEDANEEPWGVDYGKLTPYLIKAIQEQQTIIDDLKSRLDEAGL